MTYVLIAYLVFAQSAEAVSVEFNSKESCLAAATEITRQYRHTDGYTPVILCAKK